MAGIVKVESWEVAAWNKSNPVGTLVRYWPGLKEGPGIESTTRSLAWELCGEPVVMVEGKAGGVALSHVDVMGHGELRVAVPIGMLDALKLASGLAQKNGDEISVDSVAVLALEQGLDALFGEDWASALERHRVEA